MIKIFLSIAFSVFITIGTMYAQTTSNSSTSSVMSKSTSTTKGTTGSNTSHLRHKPTTSSTTKKASTSGSYIMKLALEADKNCKECKDQEDVERVIEDYKLRLGLNSNQIDLIKKLYMDNRQPINQLKNSKAISEEERTNLLNKIKNDKRLELSKILDYKQMKEFTKIRMELYNNNLKNTKFNKVSSQLK